MLNDYIRKNWRKMIPFALIGTIFNTIELGGTTLLNKVYDFPQKPSYAFCFVIATIVAYTLNTFITFKSKFDFYNFIQYFAIYVGAMLIGLNVINILEVVLDWGHEHWSYPFIAAPFVYIWNYTLTNKYLKR